MSYTEVKKIKGAENLYFVKKLSFMRVPLTIKRYVGANVANFNKEKYLIDNLEELSDVEFKFKLDFLKEIIEKLSYTDVLPRSVELKSIKINTLLEGKNCAEALNTEFAKEFIFNSNNIEGSKIPPERVKEIIESGDTSYSNRNEVKEVINSLSAFEYLRKKFKFNLPSIKRLYHILTKELFMEGNIPYPKGFKREEVIVGNSKTTPPERVEEALTSLLKWYHQNKNKIHPLILALEFHKKYEFIHPFRDGNGRTGRMIMNKILMNAGYPPIIVYKENKLNYFNALEKASDHSSKKYYHFMLEQADKTYSFLLKVVEKY